MRNESIIEIPKMSCQYLDEPLLCFADGNQHIDPKLGIFKFGPKSYKPRKGHPSTVRVGFIGSAETIDAAKQWMETNADGVSGESKYTNFPGFNSDRGFFSELVFEDDWIAQLNRNEIESILRIEQQREQFEAVLQLLETKLELLSTKDRPPEYIVVALPDKLGEKCRVADYQDAEVGAVHRDLHRAFKSMAMKYRIPTQLIQQDTLKGRSRKNEHPSVVAWNFFTGLYFKAGGFPWGPIGLQPGTCYIGISFYRPLGSAFSTMQTSLVQAFDEQGDGLVLRGHDFTWDAEKEGSKSPHLPEEEASRLVEMVLTRYEKERGQKPRRVVVHKTSRYWPPEQSGFEEVLQKSVNQYDLVALARQSIVRLLIANKYPPLRGTRFTVGDIDYLYTTGYIAELKQFHGMHVPSPIQIADHIGYDTPREQLLRDILILTKMNWNSSRLGGSSPITVRFSRLVGDIMREIPVDREPQPNFKYYM